jgi:hypothetical protein
VAGIRRTAARRCSHASSSSGTGGAVLGRGGGGGGGGVPHSASPRSHRMLSSTICLPGVSGAVRRAADRCRTVSGARPAARRPPGPLSPPVPPPPPPPPAARPASLPPHTWPHRGQTSARQHLSGARGAGGVTGPGPQAALASQTRRRAIQLACRCVVADRRGHRHPRQRQARRQPDRRAGLLSDEERQEGGSGTWRARGRWWRLVPQWAAGLRPPCGTRSQTEREQDGKPGSTSSHAGGAVSVTGSGTLRAAPGRFVCAAEGTVFGIETADWGLRKMGANSSRPRRDAICGQRLDEGNHSR